MSGRCPVDEIKVRWTLACTEATGVMAARSHYWHLHLVATSEQSLPVLLLLGWLQRRRKGASIRSQCAQLSADHRAKSSKSRISAGSGTEQRNPPLHYRTSSGKAFRSFEPAALRLGRSYYFLWGIHHHGVVPLTFALCCGAYSGNQSAVLHTTTLGSAPGRRHRLRPVQFPATASSCEAFDLQASLSLR